MPDSPFPPPPAIHTETFRLGIYINMQKKEIGASEVFAYILRYESLSFFHAFLKKEST